MASSQVVAQPPPTWPVRRRSAGHSPQRASVRPGRARPPPPSPAACCRWRCSGCPGRPAAPHSRPGPSVGRPWRHLDRVRPAIIRHRSPQAGRPARWCQPSTDHLRPRRPARSRPHLQIHQIRPRSMAKWSQRCARAVSSSGPGACWTISARRCSAIWTMSSAQLS